jgi:VWFA-related protein
MIVLSATLAASSFVSARPPQPIVRTVYVTVTDANGAGVPGLTAGDFIVTEGGTERQVQKAEPATARVHVSVMVEERLADTPVRMGIFAFAKRLQPLAETAVIAIGHRTTTLVDYTTDLDAIAAGLNRLSLVPQAHSNFSEAVVDISQKVERQRPERPVVVIVAKAGAWDGGASAKDALDRVRRSGAVLYAVAVVDFSSTTEPLPAVGETGDRLVAEPTRRQEVLEGGTKQSGGRLMDVMATAGVPKALQQIAADLSSQYVIQYTLPDGVKRDKQLTVNVTRPDVSLRAPTLIPDR